MQENEEHAELAESDGAAQDKATSGMPPAPFPSSTPDRTSPSIQSPPPQPPSPKTATSSQPDNVVDMVDQNAASTPQAVVQDINPRDVMDEYGWDDLEERFLARMGECRKKEEEINMEFREWLKVFEAWTSTTLVHEEERAHKRLRTRMSYVQGAEVQLEERRLHYIKVVQAFESALALLGGG
ncbi:hypothetical protein MMC12_005061 [Toensbergia leucococca]|nr:hypothetical protein [Toensbergia leucococca]